MTARKKMDQEFKAKWLRALRNGYYSQTCGKLRDNESYSSYCCLGVACNIVSNRAWRADGSWKHGGRVIKSKSVPDFNFIGVTKTTANTLANMNDTGKSFREIADWIEKNL